MNTDWDKLGACRESLREHQELLRLIQRFYPPQEVIDAWPENVAWVIYNESTQEWEYWHYLSERLGSWRLHPRTLHHRSKFYPEDTA